MPALVPSIDNLYEQFKRSRRFLKDVTEHTVRWYDESFACYHTVLSGRTLDQITKEDFLVHLEGLRNRKMSPISINTPYSRHSSPLPLGAGRRPH